jgi:hypothetical protein
MPEMALLVIDMPNDFSRRRAHPAARRAPRRGRQPAFRVGQEAARNFSIDSRLAYNRGYDADESDAVTKEVN